MRCLILLLLLVMAPVARAAELSVDVLGGVYHFDRNKIRNGKPLNENPQLKGLTVLTRKDNYIWQAFYMNFTNSIYEDTNIIGLGIETQGTCGVGIAGGWFITGYAIPVYAAPYGYCDQGIVRATITGVPTIGNTVDGSVQGKLSIKVLEW